MAIIPLAKMADLPKSKTLDVASTVNSAVWSGITATLRREGNTVTALFRGASVTELTTTAGIKLMGLPVGFRPQTFAPVGVTKSGTLTTEYEREALYLKLSAPVAAGGVIYAQAIWGTTDSFPA